MRADAVDWEAAASSLDERGFAPLPALLTRSECAALAVMYDDDDARFRSRIEMERFRFGVGEYKYFAAPLPPLVQELREGLYRRLAPIANGWAARLRPSGPRPPTPGPRRPMPGPEGPGLHGRYPDTLDEFLGRCHRAGQNRPTPLLLAYGAGGYNCLHQDVYGELVFPLQVVLLLTRPDVDFTGGEFLLVEQRPRAQSRGHAIRIEQGAGVVFAVRERPVSGTRGDYRAAMRHGVSTILSGHRTTLGIIFHDAK